MAQGVEYITPVDVISGETTTGSWVTVSVSANIPANAVAAIFDVYNDTTEVDFGVRAVGSTDTPLYGFEDQSHRMYSVKLNANREFQFQQQDSGFEMWLVGYVPEGAGEFVTNMVDVTPGSDSTWEDIDVGSLASSGTAGCAFFMFVGDPGAQDAFGLRMNGSTDTFTNDVRADNMVGGIIGVDVNELCEGFSEDVSASLIFYLGCVYVDYCDFNTNITDYSTGTTGSYQATTLTEIPASAAPGMAAFLFDNTGTGEYRGQLRRTGDTPAYGALGDLTYHGFFVHGYDSSSQVDQFIENTAYDLKLIGWWVDFAASSSSSSSSTSSSSSSSSSSESSSSSSSSISSSSAIPGTVVWGHDTGTIEDFIRDFGGNWTTTEWSVSGSGDDEILYIPDIPNCGQITTSEEWYLGAFEALLLHDQYQSGGLGIFAVYQFRTASTKAGISGATWTNYNGISFTCLGWCQVRIIHT